MIDAAKVQELRDRLSIALSQYDARTRDIYLELLNLKKFARELGLDRVASVLDDRGREIQEFNMLMGMTDELIKEETRETTLRQDNERFRAMVTIA